MRRLTSKQKKLLEKTGVPTIHDLSPELYVMIESLNEYETFHQDADRFLNDKYFENNLKIP